jgi:adenine-specific DNA-methyltransferase
MNKEILNNQVKAQNNNIEVLKNNFSHCFDKNGNFDFEKFKKEISEDLTKDLTKENIDFSKESYGIDWLGRSYARLLATDDTTTFLKENKEWNNKEENKNSENMLIKGDNLEVLKHLLLEYSGKIKMIYIDPPYNTGNKDFIYNDDFSIKVDKRKKDKHSGWLTFMYPRLYIARQLLKDDGVIFISIDDNEVAQLRLLMDEIFGEENFLSIITTVNNLKGRSDDNFFATSNEFLVVYAKNKLILKIEGFELEDEELDNDYEKQDEFGFYKPIGYQKKLTLKKIKLLMIL